MSSINKDSQTITLNTPIRRGETVIETVTIRRPKKAGQLRGINTVDIAQMNVDTLIKLLPRITDLTESEVNEMDPADLLQAGLAILSFLMVSQQEAYLTA